ncbi:hypothetical protein C9374_009599 [Naegleria lovaniensis]|uniref:Uncharacterized protein n=1 Tax=Naegleria lovaniensis TaxID=51637 RepID=A0AA88KR89_NAELO|nr:uncharacterized protein C9374_009599 [Naegleria lovaniensis]KAG2393022.1 hypothetical protein C9374_009599 [Naegleria lovaniensis]
MATRASSGSTSRSGTAAHTSSRKDFEVFSKYKREPIFVDLYHQQGRDAKLFYHQEGNRNVQLDYTPNMSLVERREPALVDYTKKGQFSNRLSKIINDQPSTLDYTPHYSSVHERVKGGVNMRKSTDRDKHFFSVNESKKQSITTNVGFVNAKSAIVDEPQNRFVKRATNIYQGSETHALDMSKMTSRSDSERDSNDPGFKYHPIYSATLPKISHYYDMGKQADRTKSKTAWIPSRTDSSQKHYDVSFQGVEVPVRNYVNMKKSTGRESKKKKTSQVDLSYTPNFNLTESKNSWSTDLFLTSGRRDDVSDITQSAENLVRRVRSELRKLNRLSNSYSK